MAVVVVGIVVLIQEVRTPRDFLVYGREVLPNSETPPLLRVLEDLERDDNEPVEEVRRVTLGGPEMPAYILTVANVGKRRRSLPTPACAPARRIQRESEPFGDGKTKQPSGLFSAGDSRGTLLHREGGFTPLSADHKPSDPHEKSRVEAAGGFVASPPYSVPRIDNILALSRAFGDGVSSTFFLRHGRECTLAVSACRRQQRDLWCCLKRFASQAFKDNERLPPEQQKVVAVPDVRSFYALPGDVLMLACDGEDEASFLLAVAS